jgi:hypothetical protein
MKPGAFPASDGFVQPYGDMPLFDDDVGEGAYLSVLGKTNQVLLYFDPLSHLG